MLHEQMLSFNAWQEKIRQIHKMFRHKNWDHGWLLNDTRCGYGRHQCIICQRDLYPMPKFRPDDRGELRYYGCWLDVEAFGVISIMRFLCQSCISLPVKNQHWTLFRVMKEKDYADK
jgi:hypothetical protein